MNNEPVAWIAYDEFGDFMLEAKPEGDYPWQPLYTHSADAEKVKENMDKVLKQNERLIEALANARITFDAEIEKKNTMLKMWEATHPAKTQSHTETAVKILNYLGYAQEPSKEEGADSRRDKLVEIISQSHSAKTYEDAIEECAQRAEAYAYMSENFNVLADELRAILKRASEK